MKFSGELLKLFEDIAPLILTNSLLPPMAALLQKMLEKNLISEKEFISVISIRASDFQINPEFFEGVELTDFKEKEVIMGGFMATACI